MNVSIVICTYKRPQSLKSTLESVVRLDFDSHAFEVIVVDNGCDAESHAIFEEVRLQAKCRMSYVREETLGLSYARNKGVSLSRGDRVAFLDDDELVPTDWLSELIKPFGMDDRVACVGGRIVPVFPGNTYPSWYSRDIQGFFGGVDHGAEIHDVDFPVEFIGGGNMCFKRDLIIDAGLFNVRLGIIGQSSYSGEENELALRIRNQGFRVLFTPHAVTYHMIERERISKSFLYKRCYQSGRSETLHNPLHAGSPWPLLYQYIVALLKSLGSFLLSTVRSEAARTRALLAISRSLGKIAGSLQRIFHPERNRP